MIVTTASASLSATFTSVDALLESPWTRDWGICGNANVMAGLNGMNVHMLGTRLDLTSYFGVKNLEDGGDYSAAVTANPTELAYICVFTAPIYGGTSVTTQFVIELEFDAVFMDPILVDGS